MKRGKLNGSTARRKRIERTMPYLFRLCAIWAARVVLFLIALDGLSWRLMDVYSRLPEDQKTNSGLKEVSTMQADRAGNMNSIQWKAGIYGGLIAGLVFGVMMGMMGMLEMVARVVRSESALVGFLYHLFNSAVIGALFAPLLGRFSTDKVKGLSFGLLYGVSWWFLGPLILMPLLLGMGTMLSLQGMQMALPSLLGHLIFGGILGVLYPVFAKKN